MSKNSKATAPAIDAEIKPFIEEWQNLTDWLKTAKAREMELRKYLSETFFPDPKEGVNRIITEDGFELVYDHKINRSIDEASLDDVMSALPEDSPYRNLGVLIDYKPKLILKGFRTLPEEEALIFSEAITEKPGSPSLNINAMVEAMDPATAQAPPDWPATEQPAPAKKKAARKSPTKKKAAPKKKTAAKKTTAKRK